MHPIPEAMTPAAVAILGVAALATSVLSAVVGMAGGLTLLTVMLFFFEPLVAVPLHGVVQLISNGSRSAIHRRHLRWDIVLPYAVLLLPMGFAGLWLARNLPADITRALIGAFVLLATWAPRALMLGVHPEDIDPRRRFFALGGVVGILNPAIGATGPLLAPFFLHMGLDRFALVGTKAACQALGHLAKIFVFGLAGFVFAEYLSLLVLLGVLVMVGTWLGTRILGHVSERTFTLLYQVVLSALALRLLVSAL
ncbi:MAG: sulfite exporter TauE/SafE family protein [Deltaproteobacteria bacterium]|nr:sulfite exporter TauE/SafE family protein [Deltaproteobacteria bacterium]MBW2421838.1 sulfite exporter TauE/SafE family protein [Deltaproteobacteria bacterium]